ncbi:hypothetical protein F4677DRAFT_36160 [Hypoxylon crocopeplum]|nr:hypothetical protein F4677DRAFT_36160 [Hypoxylon crocopeplum]
MAFSLSSKQIELRGSWLCAITQKADTSWTYSKLDLNKYVGNDDGEFDITTGGWYESIKERSSCLDGTFLYAQLRTKEGSYAPETCINLNLFVGNLDGCLKFHSLSDSLLVSAACLTLDNNILRGLAIGRNGKFHPSEVNLDEYYGNIGGKFEAGQNNYSLSGRDFRLEQSLDAVKLIGELRDYGGVFQYAEIDLSTHIVNRQGHLSVLEHDGWFKTDHWATVIMEQIPVLGAAIEDVYRFGNYEDRAYQEIRCCTNSILATTGIVLGAFIGRACGSPVVGMAVGAALAMPTSISIQAQIANEEDPGVRSHLKEAMLGRATFRILRDMFATEASPCAAEWLSTTFTSSIDIWTECFAVWLSKQDSTLLREISLYAMLSKVFGLLQGEVIEEWNDPIRLLYAMLRRSGPQKLQPEDFPVEGRDYVIKIYGTQMTFTCVDGTLLRLRSYAGWETQRFRCITHHNHMGFICEGANNGKGRYLGFDTGGTLVCKASHQRDREHVAVVADSQGGYMLWMAKDDHLEPVSRVSGDKLKVTPSSFTYVSFHKLEEASEQSLESEFL